MMKHVRCIIKYKKTYIHSIKIPKSNLTFLETSSSAITPVSFAISELPILMAMSLANDNLALCSVLDYNTFATQHLALM